jgi:hypothetical protein
VHIDYSGQQNEAVDAIWNVHRTCLQLRDGQEQRQSRLVTAEKQAVKSEEGKAVVCRNCRHPITAVELLSSRDGSRTHTFFNPAGIVFEIICFSLAPGCIVHGAASTEFCWFSGFTWRLAFCGNCLTHLGWLFESRDAIFFGLILKKLMGDL